MTEWELDNIIADYLNSIGHIAAVAIPHFHRCADVATITPEGDVWIIEDKLNGYEQALKQLRTAVHSADYLFIGTIKRRFTKATQNKLRAAGVGLITVDEKTHAVSVISMGERNNPYLITKAKIVGCIKKRINNPATAGREE